jgi:tetratricopeptide (TPR) repeat protein
MRHFCASLLFLGLASWAVADGPTLKEARQRWLRGNYEEARGQYEALGKDAKNQVAAAIGISQTWQSEGEYDKALSAVESALAKNGKSAELLARLADLLYLRGKWKEAEETAEKAIAIQKENFLARWVRAQVCRDRGDHKKADAECRWFVRTYSERSNADNDIKDPDELLLVGLAGAENARWHNLSDQFKVILNDVYDDAVKNDKDFWPAEYEAGMLLLEKYNRAQALPAFEKVLKINPNAAEALVAKGIAALEKFEVRDAEQLAERALKINKNLPEALRLRADIHLMTGDAALALKTLETAQKVNPRDERTLGRVAACLLLQKKQADFDALAQEVAKHDPKPGVFYFELAERLEERRRFDIAEGYYRKAIELRPMIPWSQNSLGMLLMRMGREKEARNILQKAFDADSFNIRVSNTLKVLRHLDKYETIKTDHFELRFDPKNDRPLARYMAERLEDMHAELAKKFQYSPKGLILVEVFNTHEMFSGRVVAVPDLHTIGACTGRMFAMVSPQGKGVGKPFNWSRVLRHELVHIFNLEQTNFLCPHWYTEGLAVINEGFPRPPSWNQLLLEKVPAGELLNLDTIDMAFIRPRSPVEWHQAYCQSQLYVEYMQSKYGQQTVGEMLVAYRDGLDTAAALSKVCKVDKAAFEKGYGTYLQDVVKSIKGKPAEKPMTLAQLREAQEKDPEDADLAARLAEQYVDRGRNADARKLVEGVLAKKKTHPLANYVKARLLVLAGDEDEARRLLEAALDEKSPEPKVVQLLGKLYFEAKELDKAAQTFELGRKAQPADSKWLTELVRVYVQLGNKDKQIDLLKELILTDADDLDQRKRLARMLLDAGKNADAEKYGRQALEINILDPEAQEVVLKALMGQNKNAEADKLRKLLEK